LSFFTNISSLLKIKLFTHFFFTHEYTARFPYNDNRLNYA